MTDDVLETRDWTPIEPDVLEFKYYAPGVGLVLEVDPDSGERVELININSLMEANGTGELRSRLALPKFTLVRFKTCSSVQTRCNRLFRQKENHRQSRHGTPHRKA